MSRGKYQHTFYFRDYMTPSSDWWTHSAENEIVIPFGIHINHDENKNSEEIRSFTFSKSELKNAALVVGGPGSGYLWPCNMVGTGQGLKGC